jgi:hypothetical protein
MGTLSFKELKADAQSEGGTRTEQIVDDTNYPLKVALR